MINVFFNCFAQFDTEEEVLENFDKILQKDTSFITAPALYEKKDFGRTLLHIAAIRGYAKLCEFLINQGIPIDATDNLNYTALQYAIRERHALVAKLLVDRGSFLYPPQNVTQTPSEIALQDLNFKNLMKKLKKPKKKSKIELPLPNFYYYPSPVENGSFIQQQETCAACGHLVDYIYFSYDHEDNIVCPWCIANGKAYQLLETPFNEVDYNTQWENLKEAEKIIQIVEHKTPGFYGWQQEIWLTCCNNACIYLGAGGVKELQQFGQAGLIAIQEDAMKQHGFSEKEANEYLLYLNGNNGPTAYLFQCPHCSKFKSYTDIP